MEALICGATPYMDAVDAQCVVMSCFQFPLTAAGCTGVAGFRFTIVCLMQLQSSDFSFVESLASSNHM